MPRVPITSSPIPHVNTFPRYQVLLIFFLLSGAVGLALHYRGNMEFEFEMYPALTGLDLFRETMAGATPALCPGTMLILGLLGLLYTFRHPILV